MYKGYDIYVIFKTVENEVKGKNTKILDEESYSKRVSEKNRMVLQELAGLFNTRYVNVNPHSFVKCGFDLYKSFDYSKMLRDTVINLYIQRDSRLKRNPNEPIGKIISDLKFVDRNLNKYANEFTNNQRTIIRDYVFNNIGSTLLVYCIWRGMFEPNDIEWEYLNIIKNNYPLFEKNVTKFANMIDKWNKSKT